MEGLYGAGHATGGSPVERRHERARDGAVTALGEAGGPSAPRPARPVRAWAPATVGNAFCGFDVLGLALERPGDTVTARRSTGAGVRLTRITGEAGDLAAHPESNTAVFAVEALLREAGVEAAVDLELDKGVPLASGLGSSAASAVAAVLAVNDLLQLRSGRRALLAAAVAAEGRNCGAEHADNAAPCLLGGCALCRPGPPPEAVALPVPDGLAVAILHPGVELSTAASRAVLPAAVPLAAAARQWSHVGAFVTGLFRGDLELLATALEDGIAEPLRAPLVPGFGSVRAAALGSGALGAGLSGAGPSVAALCADQATAERVAEAMAAAHRAAAGPGARTFTSPVARRGARLVEPADGP